MTPEEILRLVDEKFFQSKTIFTDSDLSTGGLLNPKQFDKFVQKLVEKTLIMNECDVQTGDEKQVKIDAIEFGSNIVQRPVAEGTEHTDTSKPTTTQVSISTVEYIIAVDLGFSSLRNNIEKENFEDTIMDMIAQKAGSDFESIALKSDTTLGTNDEYDLNDGWLKLAAVEHEIDHQSANAFDDSVKVVALFDNMIDELPTKYLDYSDVDAWRIYCHKAIERLYRKWLVAVEAKINGTHSFLLENIPVTYEGYRVVGVPRWPSGTTGSPAVLLTKALLVHPKNLIYYVQKEISFNREPKWRKRQLEITGTANIDFQVAEDDACVVTKNIKHGIT